MLGGGTFTTMNKKLAGTYINFVSAKKASASLFDRGIVTMPIELDWGEDSKVFTVTQEDMLQRSMQIFGYHYDDDALKGLRDLFKYAQKAFLYKLTSGGTKATCTYATAKCGGTRGNSLKVVITENADEMFVVELYMGTEKLNTQTVESASDLVDDAWVTYIKTASLTETAGTALTGGTNGTVTGTSHSNYLNAIESYSFNTMGVVSDDEDIIALYVEFTKRLRDSVGAKFQTVVYNTSADYEGIINVKNSKDIVWWVTGIEGACAVNDAVTNKKYDGEFAVNPSYTQAQLESAMDNGEFVLHSVGDEVRVLSDINSLVTVTAEKGEDFKSNQTIRVLDQLANDVAVLFATKYLGKIPNDADGRTSLWADIVKLEESLQDIRAIENFDESNVEIVAGETKKAVIINNSITPVNAMEQIYMVVTVS